MPIVRVIDWLGLRDTYAYRRLANLARFWASRLGWAVSADAWGDDPLPSFPRSFLDGGGEAPVRPAIRTSYAPAKPAMPPQPSYVIQAATDVDARVKALRRAAAINIFDECGLDLVPAQLWQFVDGSLWLDRAVAHFLELLGLDVEAIRSGDRAALDQANDVMLFLVDVEGAFARLRPEAIAAIEEAIFSGEYDRVRRAAEIVSIYETIARLEDRWPVELRFAAFSAFLLDVQGELSDPLSATIDDARLAEALARQMAGLMERFEGAVNRHALLIAGLVERSGSWEGWPDAPEIQSHVTQFDFLAAEVTAEEFPVDQMDLMLSRLEEINFELDAIIARRGGDEASRRKKRRDRGDARSSSTFSTLTPIEEALLFFGFSPDGRPTKFEVRAAYTRLVRKTHPDHNPGLGGDSTAFQEVQRHWDVIKRDLA